MLNQINNKLKKWVSSWLFSYNCVIGLGKGGKVPMKVFHNDAGYDLYTSESVNIKPNSRANIHTNVYLKSKRPMWMLLVGRSSTMIKHGLLVDSAVIDADYTGELFIKVYNTTAEQIHLPPSIRIAQLIVLPHTSVSFETKDEREFECEVFSKFDHTVRNNQGFGSSGL
jgi:dUTP pyrophosphatase